MVIFFFFSNNCAFIFFLDEIVPKPGIPSKLLIKVPSAVTEEKQSPPTAEFSVLK